MGKKQLGWVVLCALALATSPMLPQQLQLERIRYAATCASCRIQFTKLFTVGNPTDRVLLTKSPIFARDGKGRFFSASFDNAQIVVFDSTGSFLTVMGRSGVGPGEFPVIQQGPTGGPEGRISKVVVGRGDSVFVFEDGGRVSVIAPDLRIVRSFRLPLSGYIGDVYALPNGSFVVGCRVRTAAYVGWSMVLFDSDGNIVTGLGPEHSVGGNTAVPVAPAMNFILSHDARSVWTYSNRFKLDQWSLANVHLRSLEVAGVSWLPEPTVTTRQGRAGSYPVSVGSGQLTLAGLDSRGRLWFSGRGPVQEGQTSATAPRRIEVFDPERRELVISQQAQSSDIVWLFPRSDFGYSAHSDSDGVRYFTIWKVSASSPTQ